MVDEKCKQMPCMEDYNINRRNTEMNSWREEECPSPADTYIERRFEHKCRQLRDGFSIITEWRTRKRYYISVLDTVSIDFQHFSRHDDTHSINILEAIEMLLGKARVDMLSAGDLWLLLECAYAHDTGMALRDEEIRNLWKDDPKFQTYIKHALEHADDPNHKQARLYRQIDNLLSGNSGSEEIGKEFFSKEWPADLSQSILLLMSDYIRSRHAGRVWEVWGRRDENSDPVIPKRLDRAVQTASELHGKDFKYILSDLSYCCKGFGNGKIHPRFAAAMLRMGDMLDLDNNRFNPRTVEHFGDLPHVSMLHYEKHQAITHLAIKESGIEVKAESKDIEACKVLSDWFDGLEKETKDLICNWNQIAPEELKGCLLKPSDCEISYVTKDEKGDEKKEKFQSRIEREFQVNKDKLIGLLGTGIYDGSMDFIREYLQNALDATKMQFWKDWEKKAFQFNGNVNQNVLKEELSPFDFGRDIYDQYEIQIEISLDVRKQKVKLSFIDHGIGMEQDCIDILAKVGTGWRGRKEYSADIKEMPKWLSPTGGFGIGVQSAFMVTDKVTIITRDKDSTIGRKIVLTDPKEDGRVTEEGSVPCERGTTVEIELDMSFFYESAYKYHEFAEKEKEKGESHGYEKLAKIEAPKDFFSCEQVKHYLVKFLKEYIAIMIPDALFPIRVIYPQRSNDICVVVRNKFFLDQNYWDTAKQNPFYRRIEKGEEKYQLFLQLRGEEQSVLQAALWDIRKNILYCFLIGNFAPNVTKEMKVCFKNVIVKEEVTSDFNWLGRCGLLVDYMGFKAEEILKTHRDKFDDTFRKERQREYIQNAYKIMLSELEKGKKDCDGEIGDIITSYLNNLDTVMLRLLYVYEDINNISMDDIKGNVFISGRLLNNVFVWDESGYPSNEQFVQEIVEFLWSGKSIIIQSDRISQSMILYSIPVSNMETWKELQGEDKKKEREDKLKSDGAFKFLYGLQQCGNVIVKGEYADLLLRLFAVEMEGFQFNNSGDKYAKLTLKYELLQNDEKKIFRSSYTEVAYTGRCYVAENLYADFFPNLQVHFLPFCLDEKSARGMIISPISGNAYREINRMALINGPLNFEVFLDCIVKQDDYEALVKYVCNDSRKQKHYLGEETVKKEYERYIRKIYEAYVEEGVK